VNVDCISHDLLQPDQVSIGFRTLDSMKIASYVCLSFHIVSFTGS